MKENEVGRVWLFATPLLGTSVRNSTLGKGHEEGGSALRKGEIEAQETPCFRASTPKSRVPTLLSYALTYTSDFMGGWPPHTSVREGVNWQLQSITISWVWQECFNLRTPLKVIYRACTVSSRHIWLFTASHPWEAWDVLDLLKADSFRKLEIISIVGWLGIILVKGFFIYWANVCC